MKSNKIPKETILLILISNQDLESRFKIDSMAISVATRASQDKLTLSFVLDEISIHKAYGNKEMGAS